VYYEKRTKGIEVTQDMIQELTPVEKKLVDSQELMEIRGKV
jgi:hypothetical protein